MPKNISGIKRGFVYDPNTQSLGIFLNGIRVADYTEVAGRIYHVNNITGASTNDGLSWGASFA